MKGQFILGFLAVSALVGCSTKREEILPQTKKLTAAVYASGSLLPEQEYRVVSAVEGYLSQSLVKEGDSVQKGKLLFVLTSEVRQAQEQGADAVLRKTLPVVADNAPALRELRSQIALAREKLAQDSLQYVRYKRLHEANAIATATLERYDLQYQTARRDLQNLRSRLSLQEMNSELQLQQAKNQLTLSQAQSDVGKLRSFVSGRIYDIYKKEGDLVAPNQSIALIGAGKMIAKLLVDEDDLGKIYQGQPALITMDAYPDKIFKAHIQKIYPLLNKVEQSFRVDASFDEAIPAALYGLNLEANIIVEGEKDVLVLPKRAVLKGDSVLIKENGKERKVKIEKGIEDDEYVEVRQGIRKDQVVIIEP